MENAVVKVRDRAWRVQASQEVAANQLFLSLLDMSSGEHLQVLCPPEEYVVLPDPMPVFSPRAVSPFQVWAHDHAALALSCVEPDSLGALFTGRIQPEPYQFMPARKLVQSPRSSLLIADDVGLGKTIEAGIIMHELIARGRGNRILLVVPPGLIAQWREEMEGKFGMLFQAVENAAGLERAQTELSEGIKPWTFLDRVITSIEYLKKKEVLQQAVRRPWDIIVVDEAHYLAESGTPRNPFRTARARLGMALRQACSSLVLLTATPHNGYGHSFRSLLELIEPTDATFAGDRDVIARRVQRTMIRRLKPQITKTRPDGKLGPAFVPREPVRALAVTRLSEPEKQLFRKVSSYCARTVKAAAKEDDADLIGFAMQIVKKRMLSSRQALRNTLLHRLDSLKSRQQQDEESPTPAEVRELQGDLPLEEATHERIARRVVRAGISKDQKRRAAEKRQLAEFATILAKLESTPDPKVTALVADIQTQVLPHAGEKAIVFTEYRDTLAALRTALGAVPELAGKVVELTGGLTSRQRQTRLADFAKPETRLLLATDAASEGLNLQDFCHRLYHVELPWNPNRLEQRNGRIDRHGQPCPPVISYLHYPDSPEDEILDALVRKIVEMQGDRVSTPDILGILTTARIEEALTSVDAEAGDSRAATTSLFRVIEEKRGDFVREMQPLLAAGPVLYADADDWRAMQCSADPIEADDVDLEELVVGRLGERLQPGKIEHTWRLVTPPEVRGPGVRDCYDCLTMRRSVAIRFPSRDVEYVNRLHPLFQALVHQALGRLTGEHSTGSMPPRLAVRRHPLAADGPIAVFTYLLRQQARPVELIGLSIRPDGTLIEDVAYARLPMAIGAAVGDKPWPEVCEEFENAFPRMQQAATAGVEARVRRRLDDAAQKRLRLADMLMEDAGHYKVDRLAEIDREESLAKSVDAERNQRQLSLFETREVTGFDARRASVETFYQQRVEELKRYAETEEPHTLQPLGVLFVFPPEEDNAG